MNLIIIGRGKIMFDFLLSCWVFVGVLLEIFLGIFLVISALIILLAIFIGDGEDDAGY